MCAQKLSSLHARGNEHSHAEHAVLAYWLGEQTEPVPPLSKRPAASLASGSLHWPSTLLRTRRSLTFFLMTLRTISSGLGQTRVAAKRHARTFQDRLGLVLGRLQLASHLPGYLGAILCTPCGRGLRSLA